jgi:hypothetical protein
MPKPTDAKRSAERVKQRPDFLSPDPQRLEVVAQLILPLNPDVRTGIYPEFSSPKRHKVTATMRETGEFQEWTGVAGQVADYWIVRGYSELEIGIDVEDGGGWRPCVLTVTRPPREFPGARWIVLAECGDAVAFLDARVLIESERGQPLNPRGVNRA